MSAYDVSQNIDGPGLRLWNNLSLSTYVILSLLS